MMVATRNPVSGDARPRQVSSSSSSGDTPRISGDAAEIGGDSAEIGGDEDAWAFTATVESVGSGSLVAAMIARPRRTSAVHPLALTRCAFAGSKAVGARRRRQMVAAIATMVASAMVTTVRVDTPPDSSPPDGRTGGLPGGTAVDRLPCDVSAALVMRRPFLAIRKLAKAPSPRRDTCGER